MESLGDILREYWEHSKIAEAKMFVNSQPQYLTFKSSKGMRTAEIIYINKLTVIAKPVIFGKRSLVSGITQILGYEPPIKLKQKHVTIYGKGIIPIF